MKFNDIFKNRELHLQCDDFILFLKIDFAAKSNKNNNKFELKFEDFEKKENNSLKKKNLKIIKIIMMIFELFLKRIRDNFFFLFHNQ